jgi:hypothetical protein
MLLHKQIVFFPLVTFSFTALHHLQDTLLTNSSLLILRLQLARQHTTHSAQRKTVLSYKLEMADLALQRLRLEDTNASTVYVPLHPWIELIGKDTLNIRIRLFLREEFKEAIPSFCQIFAAFPSVNITKVRMSLRLPGLAKTIDHKEELSSLFSALVKDLNKFQNLSQLDIVFRMPNYSLPQHEDENYFWILANANYFYDLEFPAWKLFYTVGASERIQVPLGSRLSLRIYAIWILRHQEEEVQQRVLAQLEERPDLNAMGRLDF